MNSSVSYNIKLLYSFSSLCFIQPAHPNVDFAAATQTPSAPRGLSVQAGSTAMLVSWSDPNGAQVTEYELR